MSPMRFIFFDYIFSFYPLLLIFIETIELNEANLGLAIPMSKGECLL
jgi:hypothetical protein